MGKTITKHKFKQNYVKKLNLQKLKENPDPFKYNIETKLESTKTQETGIKSSNERWTDLKDIL